MFNLLLVLAATDDADRLARDLAEAGQGLPGALSSTAGSTLPRALNGGSLMWRLTFATEADHWASVGSANWRDTIEPLLSRPGTAVLDRIAYRPSLSDASAGRQRPGIWRCLTFTVDAGTPAGTVERFERDLTLMPAHVSTIGNWSLGNVVASEGRRRWSHVWEQEFDDVGGLEGEYMTDPIHWGLVDGWFDPECPQRIVDPFLIHAAIDIREAVIR